jgi:hypothetical protein
VFRRLKVSLRNLCCRRSGYAFLFVLIKSLLEMGNCTDGPVLPLLAQALTVSFARAASCIVRQLLY